MTVLNAPDISPRSHAAKRLSIVDAAANVFCREGFAGANIDMVAAEAGVSRQTVYNHHGDKEALFAAVVRDVTDRISAEVFETLASFPDRPVDLKEELTGFAQRMACNCMCSRDGRFLRKLIQSEGERYPELFAVWRENGPDRTNAALAARLARLALSGHLDLPDPDIAARQFLALIYADMQVSVMLGKPPEPAAVRRSCEIAVDTFLRAYGRRDA